MTEWQQRRRRAARALVVAREAIDYLAEVAPDDDVDQKLCFAGNTIEGAAALLREAHQKATEAGATVEKEQT